MWSTRPFTTRTRSASSSSRAAAYVELKTTTSALPVGSSSVTKIGLALRRHLLETRDDAADRDELAVAPLEIGERAVGLPSQLGPHALERVLGDVQAERLLLEPQELALVELVVAIGGCDLDRSALAERPVEDGCLTGEPVGGDALAVAERRVEGRECPGGSHLVESSAPHFTSDRARACSEPAGRRAR